jgi:transposase
VLYDRLKSKGKPEKVIKIAIAHKLLRQAFAVVLKGQNFDPKMA